MGTAAVIGIAHRRRRAAAVEAAALRLRRATSNRSVTSSPSLAAYRGALAAFVLLFGSASLFRVRRLPAEDHPAVPVILARAESLFQSMKARDYPAIFAASSARNHGRRSSRRRVRPGATRRNPSAPARDPVPGLEADPQRFHRGRADRAATTGTPSFAASIPTSHWSRAAGRSAPWGRTARRSSSPTMARTARRVLKMFREDGGWKAGLVETFWSR